MDTNYELVIGSKNYSSWSLRPWLLMKVVGIPFRETLIRLRQPGTKEEISRHSPSSTVPLLKSGELRVWESLAIVEYLAETHPDKSIWPADKGRRAVARAVSSEIHGGFVSLRHDMPLQYVNRPGFPQVGDKTPGDITRVVALWTDCRRRYGAGGEFLFGEFSGADAMFAPVASRFISYAVDLAAFGDDGTAARYRDMMMNLPEMLEWAEGAKLDA
jgi:glutathione S-transferase